MTSQTIQYLDEYMLEMSYPKMNKKLSSLWTRDNASYKSNLWMNKANKRNTIYRRVIHGKQRMVKMLSMKIYPNMDNVNKGNPFIQLGRYKMFS